MRMAEPSFSFSSLAGAKMSAADPLSDDSNQLAQGGDGPAPCDLACGIAAARPPANLIRLAALSASARPEPTSKSVEQQSATLPGKPRRRR